MSESYSTRFGPSLEALENFFTGLRTEFFLVPPAAQKLKESMEYSLGSGGKRFRPLLSLLAARWLGQPESRVYFFAAAVEMIHTYSLIHDDLPCMDNDDLRRGQPTNHRVYGEALALLAGDALQAAAFELILIDKESSDSGKLLALLELSRASGFRGMVGGQTMDILGKKTASRPELEQIHRLKTGALITASLVGAAQLLRADAEQAGRLRQYGECLGLAFQVADDLLDGEDESGSVSFLNLLGRQQTQSLLEELTQASIKAVKNTGRSSEDLVWLAEYNATRKA